MRSLTNLRNTTWSFVLQSVSGTLPTINNPQHDLIVDIFEFLTKIYCEVIKIRKCVNKIDLRIRKCQNNPLIQTTNNDSTAIKPNFIQEPSAAFKFYSK